MVKGGAELKKYHFMLKYKDLFVAQNISVDMIAFMGGASIGREAVDIQDTMGQAMGVAGN